MSSTPMPMEPSRRIRRSENARPLRAFSATLLIALFVGATGCAEEPDEAVTTTDQLEYEGVSRDQIESRAEPMTPAEAEALGIIDTTIRLQPPMNPDSVVPLHAQPMPGDTVPR